MPALKNPKHELCHGGLRRCYVYILLDPRDGSPFYVGKGKRKRYARHWLAYRRRHPVENSKKFEKLADIAAAGLEPIAVYVADDLTETAALLLERATIAEIGRKNLTNLYPGEDSLELRELVSARDMQQRIIPFDEWMRAKPRSAFEQDTYWFVVDGLKELEQYAKAAV